MLIDCFFNQLNRFELITKNAELQEKIVTFQTTLAETRKEQRKTQEKYDDDKWTWGRKEKEMEEKLKEALTVIIIIIVNYFRFKSKGLKCLLKDKSVKNESFLEELRGLCLDEEFAEKIEELRNQVIELEEEKGSLQLKLVDAEDIKGKKYCTILVNVMRL
jgi:hypothetical protein